MTKEKMDVENNDDNFDTGFSRRDFLKIAGVTTAVGATAGAVTFAAPGAALAAYENPASFGVNMAVKYVDTPPYDLPPYADGSKLQRTAAENNAFNNVDLQKQSFGGRYWILPTMDKREQKCKEGVAGFSIRDLAFGSAVEKSSENELLMDWGTGYKSRYVEAAGKWEDDPANNSRTIKKFAHFVGAGATGICEMQDQWYFSTEKGKKVSVSDQFTEPAITDEEFQIPSTMKYAVVITIPLEGSVAKFTPTRFGSASDNYGYSQMSEVTSKIAEFIRQLGYQAIPLGNNTAQSIPMGVMAGLGEVGRHGLLISPEYGSNCKVCKVLTDMPLAVDKPIMFGAAEFCRTCMKCAHECPSKSISMDKDPSYEVQCPSNNPGAKRWTVNTWTCLTYWVENGGGCYVCMRNCTYSKPQTWVHDVVKVVSSKTSMFNPIFSKMDDAFGYGKTWESFSQADIDAWWNDDKTRMFNWNKM